MKEDPLIPNCNSPFIEKPPLLSNKDKETKFLPLVSRSSISWPLTPREEKLVFSEEQE